MFVEYGCLVLVNLVFRMLDMVVILFHYLSL